VGEGQGQRVKYQVRLYGQAGYQVIDTFMERRERD
jgi:hypothetical protein